MNDNAVVPANFLRQVSVLVLTFDEAPNIGRTLEALAAFGQVVVLDSGSTDGTVEIASRFPNVRVVARAFDNHGAQWNHGLSECGLTGDWVLALDADYQVPPALVDEIAALSPPGDVDGYETRFRYCIHGAVLSASLYPPVVTLFRRTAAHYVQDGHTQRVRVTGSVRRLVTAIRHDDRKPLRRWLASQERYAQLECELLVGKPWAALAWRDKLRRTAVVTPWLVPLYCLTVGRCALDGWPGLYYALQRGLAEAVLSLKLIEKWIQKG